MSVIASASALNVRNPPHPDPLPGYRERGNSHARAGSGSGVRGVDVVAARVGVSSVWIRIP